MDQPFDIDPRRLEELRRRAVDRRARDDAEANAYQRKNRPPPPSAGDSVVDIASRRRSARKPVRHGRGYTQA